MTKVDKAHSKSEKYYKQFDFFFNRSCFRIMTEFYKVKFNKFYKDQMTLLKRDQSGAYKQKQKQGGLTGTGKEEMDALILMFLKQTFGDDVVRPEGKDRNQMVNSMIMIVFSHRYSKGDRFIVEAEKHADSLVDFSLVRDVMYKYSKKAQERFFAHPIEAFFFSAFALSDEGF